MCGLVAVTVGTFLVIGNVVWHPFGGSWLQDTTAVLLFAASLGCFSAEFRSVARNTPVLARPQSGDWRRSERIDRQFAARPPAMLPEDRDVVIARADRSLGPSVVTAERLMWIPVGWTLAWVGLLVSGLATVDRLTVLLIPPVFAVLQSAPFIAAVSGAGRADAARRRALTLPPLPPPEPQPQRKPDPRGSKLALPDE